MPLDAEPKESDQNRNGQCPQASGVRTVDMYSGMYSWAMYGIFMSYRDLTARERVCGNRDSTRDKYHTRSHSGESMRDGTAREPEDMYSEAARSQSDA